LYWESSLRCCAVGERKVASYFMERDGFKHK
jgi:hypothetical protein